MVLVPWRCYEGLSCFSEEMDQLFDRFFGKELIDRPWQQAASSRLSVKDSDDEVLVELEIPGFSPKELEITFENRTLIIKGAKTKDKQIRKGEVRYVGTESGSFTRTVPIHYRIDAENIRATYTQGRLSVVLPKIKEKPSAVKIKVQ
jgi:HSP20 family protein